jgi:hypothetical protein
VTILLQDHGRILVDHQKDQQPQAGHDRQQGQQDPAASGSLIRITSLNFALLRLFAR